MRSKSELVTVLAVCATILLSVRMLASAGDLNPPAGPIRPSGASISDVYAAVTESKPAPEYLSCGGHQLVVPASGSIQLAEGNGIVQSISQTFGGGTLYLKDGTGRHIAHNWIASNITTESGKIELNVRFSNGLFIHTSATAPTPFTGTIIYKPDSGS
jgi:hypothetical protein